MYLKDFFYQGEKFSMRWDIENQIFSVRMRGQFEEKEADLFRNKITEILNDFPQSETFKILVDATGEIRSDSSARRIFTDVARLPRKVKAAVYGKSSFVRIAYGFLVSTVGKGEDIKFFNTQEEASNWIKIQ